MTAKRQKNLTPPFRAFHLLVMLPSRSPDRVSRLNCGFPVQFAAYGYPCPTLRCQTHDSGLGGVLLTLAS
ncbi:MAG: hypothetical protein ACI95X_000477, partial [Paraglaciecola sp.]